ncbi:MAG: hypothetical protein KBD51_00475 [Candidatus Levybacteria bacterium]|nr:hypothetical protein [Candidatus Levybacteria bacterium]
MGKIFLALILVFGLFLFSRDQAHAAPDSKKPVNLNATPYCDGNSSKIRFEWENFDFDWADQRNNDYIIYISEFYPDGKSIKEVGYPPVIQPARDGGVAYTWSVEACDPGTVGFGRCTEKAPGNAVTSMDCSDDTPDPPPGPTNRYNCTNRSPACSNLDKYPPENCVDYPYSEQFDCIVRPSEPNDARCAMENHPGGVLGDTREWTKSCAHKAGMAPPPKCTKKIGDSCNGAYNTVANCCGGQVCVNPGAHLSAGDGTCQRDNSFLQQNDPLSLPCEKNGSSYSSNKGCLKIKTALGNVRTDSTGFTRWMLGFVLSISGGIVIIIIIVAGYKLMTSQGNPDRVKNARDQLTAAIVGLLFIIFSLALLELITRDILGLPGFGS